MRRDQNTGDSQPADVISSGMQIKKINRRRRSHEGPTLTPNFVVARSTLKAGAKLGTRTGRNGDIGRAAFVWPFGLIVDFTVSPSPGAPPSNFAKCTEEVGFIRIFK